MIEFSIVCLVVIILVMQHLLNWFWRVSDIGNELIVLKIAATIVSIVVTFFCVYLIISWGNLIR